MEHIDALMLSPASTALSAPSTEAQPAQPQQHAHAPGDTHTSALTPRTSATISQLVPRQYPQELECQPHSWLTAQVWQYFDDSGYERSSALGIAGHELRAQHKCRCLYCDRVVTATPTTMATHIVSACRIADGTAKRALRTGKADLLTTLDVAPVHAKPQLPEALGLVASNELARAEAPAPASSSFASPSCGDSWRRRPATVTTTSTATAAAGPRTVDYVSAFEWEANELRKRSRRSAADATNASASLDDAVKRAEALIHASVVCTKSTASETQDKENMPPRGKSNRSDDTVDVKASAAKRPRLSAPSPNGPKRGERKTQQPKKRLFAASPELKPPTRRPQSDIASLVRDLTVACIAERVPIAFLSSATFAHAMQCTSDSAFEPADVQQRSVAALEELAAPVDSVCDRMRASPSSALTFVVQRMASLETRRAVVYLVDAAGASALVSCQQAGRGRLDDDATAVWLDEVQQHYVKVSEWCGQPLHVCVVDYPHVLARQLLNALASSSKSERLVGSCMAQAFARVRCDVLALLLSAPDVVQACAELALLVNEVERLPLTRQHSSAQPDKLLLLAPRGDSIVSYAVLLTQVLRLQERFATTTTYQSARDGATTHTPRQVELLSRANEILSGLHAQRTVVSTTLALLRPLAVAELLLQLQTRASASMKLTSGVFVCLELWLFALVDRSLLLTTPEQLTWSDQFIQRLRATRMDHELACLLLDPRMAGAGLSAQGRCAARASVVAVAKRTSPSVSVSALETQLVAYVSKTGVFCRQALWSQPSTADPLAFWRGVEHARELQSVALLVCSYAPCSPSGNGHALQLDPGADLDQATRAAQVRHHLEHREVLRDPASLSSRAALELLQFLVSDDCAQSLESRELEALAWRPRNHDARSLQPQAVLQSASPMFAAALRATIATATAARDAAPRVSHAPVPLYLLQTFSDEWIDCSSASVAAMHRALAALSAAPAATLS